MADPSLQQDSRSFDSADYDSELIDAGEDSENCSSEDGPDNKVGYTPIKIFKDGEEGQQLSILEQLHEHINSTISYNRQLSVGLLSEYFRLATDQKHAPCLDQALDFLERISNDREYSLRFELMQQLPYMALLCRKAPQLLEGVISRHILGIIFKYLKNWEAQRLWHAAESTLLTLLDRDLLDEEQIEFLVCPRILHLTTHQVHNLPQVISLICKMGPHIGPDLMVKVFLERFLTLCEDKDCSVRRICATYFAEFCDTVTEDEQIYDKLLLQFTLLCVDNAKRVREACADVMLSFARYVLPQRQILASLMINFLTDESTSVQMSAFQILGPFIALFSTDLAFVSQSEYGELVFKYDNKTDLTNNSISCPTTEGILSRSLADDRKLTKMLSSKDMLTYQKTTESVNQFLEMFGLQDEESGKLEDSKIFEGSESVSMGLLLQSMNPQNFINGLKQTPRKNSSTKIDYLLDELKSIVEEKRPETKQNDVCREHYNKICQKIYNSEIDKYNTFQYYRVPTDDNLEQEIASLASNLSENTEEKKQQETVEVTTTVAEDKPALEPSDSSETLCEIKDAEEDDNSDSEDVIIDYQRREQRNKSSSSNTASESGVDSIYEIPYYENRHFYASNNYNSFNSSEDSGVTKSFDRYNHDYECSNRQTGITMKEYVTRIWVDNEIKYPSISGDSSCDKRSTHTISENKLYKMLTKYDLDRGNIVPEILINFYVRLAMDEETEEYAHYCAFSFPAVVMTLGRNNWHLLKKAYQMLAGKRPWKVRRTIASGIHEVATILGDELSGRDLVPIYEGFIKDLDEVRIGALKNLASFLEIVRPEHRTPILVKLGAFLPTDTVYNWRYRKVLADQLSEVILLFKPCNVTYNIAPVALQLLHDKVAAVRKAAIELVSNIVEYLGGDMDELMYFMKQIRGFLSNKSSTWVSRQTFALLCCELVTGGAVDGKIFAKELLPYLLNLSFDKVPNVRLVVARTLANHIVTLPADWLGTSMWHEVDRRVKLMRQDNDRDVRHLACGVPCEATEA